MADIALNDKAPAFRMAATGGQTLALADFAGRVVVLYFYPKDDTSGCTQQACDFRDGLAAFNGVQAAVIGVSRDDLKSHERFAKKYGLTFPLASDADGQVTEAYGVWTEKSMYGRKYMGIERSTFLIDPQGRIAQIWRKVKVPGHVAEVAAAVKALAAKAAAA